MENITIIAAHVAFQQLRGLSPHTIRNSERELARLASFIAPVMLSDATEADLSRWATSLLPLGDGSRHVKISRVRAFYRWAYENDYLPAADPARRMPRPRAPRGVPRPIPASRLDQALDDAPDDIRLWLALAAFAGLRCCEIAPLTREQIDLEPPPMLTVRGKGRKQRTVPIGPRLVDELARYGLPDAGPLFARLDGIIGTPSAARVSSRGNGFLHTVGIPDTMHSLRHRYGTEVQRQCGDLNITATLLGHENVNTARGYAAVSDSRMLAAVLAVG